MQKLNFERLLQNKQIADYLHRELLCCVKYPDWRVDRKCPDFVNDNQLSSIIRQEDYVLHLGMGNGACYDNLISKHQMSISDRLYFDPIEIIEFYFKEFPIVDYSEIRKVCLAIRNKLLISIHLDWFLQFNDIHLFDESDFMIYQLYNYFKTTYVGYSETENIVYCLLEILNDIENCFNNRISLMTVSYFGNKIFNNGYAILSIKNPKRKQSFTINHVENYLYNKFIKYDSIIIDDFMNIDSLHIRNKFNYIMGVRSDAFLGDDYWRFIRSIIKRLRKDGCYISDGVLSSYYYHFNYEEYIKFIHSIKDHADNLFLCINEHFSRSTPIQAISGIIYINDSDVSRISGMVKKEYRVLPARLAELSEAFMWQCAWSDLYSILGNKVAILENMDSYVTGKILEKIIGLKQNNPFQTIDKAGLCRKISYEFEEVNFLFA